MSENATRSHWMGVLAKAPGEALAQAFAAFGESPGFIWLRPPEFGAVMARGRMGGAGVSAPAACAGDG